MLSDRSRSWIDQERPKKPARAEVSADARHIVKHLWIIGIVVPLGIAILSALVRAAS